MRDRVREWVIDRGADNASSGVSGTRHGASYGVSGARYRVMAALSLTLIAAGAPASGRVVQKGAVR